MKPFTIAVIVFFHLFLFALNNVDAKQAKFKVPKTIVRPLTQADINGLLIAHNNVRLNAQPAPNPDLSVATWDEKLARKASKEVVKCNAPDQESGSGVNFMYTQSSSYISRDNFPARVVSQWSLGSQFYTLSTNKCMRNGTVNCNGYLQLVVAASPFTFGCARSITCPSTEDVKPHTEYVVCYYSQAPTSKRPYRT